LIKQSKIKNPKSKIQDPKFKIQNPKSLPDLGKLLNLAVQPSSSSNIQNPKSKIPLSP
jgi:hypothetical protein